MCDACWESYGSPKIKNDKIESALLLVKEIYKYNLVGGHLHIVLDDWNLENESLDFCEKSIENNDLSDTVYDYQNFKNIEHACINIFRALTEKERASVLYWFAEDN